ncbi:YkvA family protein [Clostridium sp. ZS2-4]|uniref:YkvA family protein n=1 Tax=Clostridium sp. ZS2-4 TaxID=2987703 RepID=UPI00227AF9E9|nr:YkvA family protein [Clostridium sp. ZS2-4]MCY6355088.1 YkvA family protein [Clostridium sp. ZS2-4]
MNISDIRVRLTEADLLGMIVENVKLQGLEIEKIQIKELIKVEGYYTKGLKIGFSISLGLGSVENNILKLRLFNIRVAKIPVWSKIVDFALKKILKNFESMGISMEKSTIYLNFTSLSKYIPAVDFTIKHITLFKSGLEVELQNLIYSQSKEAMSLDELKSKLNEGNEECCEGNMESEKKNTNSEDILMQDEIIIVNKTKDEYSKIREGVENRVSAKYKDFAEYAMLIPDIIALLYRIMRDKRVKSKTKVFIGAAIGYLALPLDILPDSIPVVGKIDDVGIVLLVLDKIIDDIPEHIIVEHWQGKEDIITRSSEIRELSFSVIGRKNTISVLSGIFVLSRKMIHRKKKFRSR